MKKKILVFGGSGFLGSYVIDELLNRNYELISADINPSKFVSDKYFKKCDILDLDKVDELVREANIVYNLAGLSNIDEAANDPLKAINLNINGNLNILESCKKNKIKHFIFASSAYSMSDKGSFYGISKLASEKLIEEYHKKFNLDYTIVRYGSIYGERDYPNNYIFNLIKTAMKTNEINHSGTGDEIREYIHAADVAKLSVDIMEVDEFKSKHIILTGVEKMRRKELFYMINEILDQKLKISFTNDGYPNHYHNTPYSFLPTRSKKLVANPYIDLGQGIIECMKEIKKNDN